jgi:hypothetical protein
VIVRVTNPNGTFLLTDPIPVTDPIFGQSLQGHWLPEGERGEMYFGPFPVEQIGSWEVVG